MAEPQSTDAPTQEDTQDHGGRQDTDASTVVAEHRTDPTTNDSGINHTVARVIQPDLDIDDEGYADSISSTYLSSIASEVLKGFVENERTYSGYGKHTYGMPVDDEEMDRMGLQHHKTYLILGERHFLAPIDSNPLRILDLGTGTGMWALDVADMYPSAQVIGVDIAPIQPMWVAANCQFEIDDIEEPWTWEKESFDFIHLREPLLMIRDWPALLQEIYDHLAPGGYCELASVLPIPMCDDGTMPEDSGFLQVCHNFADATQRMGTPSNVAPRFKDLLQDAGLVDVTETIFKIPSSPWAKDKRLKTIGALELANLVEGAAAFGMHAFTHALGWTRDEVEIALMRFRRDASNRHYHQYCQ